ncbi:hypothetical protein [Vibrio sp. CAU 1672]|uniref:hypothetical protein n=1 Tax=Vibrio sp. CAU 1672 TaxID=3032594 RepID=UPI0023D97FDA|nr:hypothetical protein [Vibrio sp. CAU 1672]MDF2155022.1 hypothetical protein [Vibrio sp. CAU 1672]
MKIKTDDLRKIRYYEKFFSLLVNGEVKTYDSADIDFRLENINSLINKLNELKKFDIKNDLLSLKREVEKNLIPNDELSWISKNNHRLCHFIWSYFRLANKGKITELIEYEPNIFSVKKEPIPLMGFSSIFGLHDLKTNNSIYETLKLNNKPNSIDNIHNLIVNYIDDIELDIKLKTKLINNIYAIWLEIEKKDKHSWIDKENIKQLIWIIDYFHKNSMSIDFIPIHSNRAQMYYAIISALDLWDINSKAIFQDIEKKSFTTKMKKSWKQKQYRDSLNTNSINLSKKALEQLDLLSKNHSKSHTKTLELIIKEQYENIISK